MAFFSYIMDNFMSLMTNSAKKFANPEKNSELRMWQLSFQLYQDTPLELNFLNEIDRDFRLYWLHDRLGPLLNSSREQKMLPLSIKVEILSEFVFCDLVKKNYGFFSLPLGQDKEFIFELMHGLMPRSFEPDCILAEENAPIEEMLYILNGLTGIGFSRLGRYNPQLGPYFISLKQKGAILVCDHYLLSRKKSNFLYIAHQETNSFALSSTFIFHKLFKNRNHDY